MGTSAGILCQKASFGCTIIDEDGVAADHDIAVPSNMNDRGEALAWLAQEAQRIVELNGVETVGLQKAGGGKFGGASAERYEVEAAVQIGLHEAGAALERLNREQVRAAMGEPKAKGAYEKLLNRAEVKARSNAVRRDQYLLALAVR
ncbi:MAG: hypothetical protein HOB12_06215 [Gemmatimonadales bacterium]|nr:hypothetical protein [Gemmatimonadales bacterium]MBT5044321.1 hypothetical protein [Gemmatimonadales bacterium]MBT6695229.1 hypothetical protein [Gemmatimonadales bacterium]